MCQGGQPGELATSSDIESLVKNLNLEIHDRIKIWRLGPYVPNWSIVIEQLMKGCLRHQQGPNLVVPHLFGEVQQV